MLSPAAILNAADALRADLLTKLAAEGDISGCDIVHGAIAQLESAAAIIDAMASAPTDDALICALLTV